jgi:type III pantothenate kinase
MNLIIDIGNSNIKVALMENRLMHAFIRMETIELRRISQLFLEYTGINAGIVSSVNQDAGEVILKLDQGIKWLTLKDDTPLPFRNKYATPATLGNDRIAGIAAARHLFPGENVLVIDAGSAITYDLITSEGEYLGGAIAPGIRMRYKALHTFTGRLPLLDKIEEATPVGDTTATSIHSGVLNGALYEAEGFIRECQRHYNSLTIILTGGDYNYFDKQLKVKTFAAPNLVLEGLNLILDHNLDKI